MQGQTIDDEDLENCANELQTAVSIAQALVPLSPPMYMSDIALGPEMMFINVLYHMTRCVCVSHDSHFPFAFLMYGILSLIGVYLIRGSGTFSFRECMFQILVFNKVRASQ